MENYCTTRLKWLSGYKVKAGALQLSIYIAVIIALILMGLMLYARTFMFLKEQSRAAIENISTADYGMSVLLNDNTVRRQNDTISLLVLDDNQSVRTNITQWGVYQKACVVTEHRKKRFTKMAIVGAEVNTANAPTLYLQDNYSPLSVVGNTSLSGNIYIPAAGIKPGYINGEGYNDADLARGSVKKSQASLPAIDGDILSGVQLYLRDNNSGYIERDGKDFVGKFSNSFAKPTQKIHSENLVVLENTTFIGNIIIKSDTLVRVKKTAIIKDAILIAPVIEIEDGFNGSFQAIASDKIVVGKDCNLLYPTALVVSKRNSMGADLDKNLNQIFIDKGSKISGAVFFIQDGDGTNDYNTNVFISESVKIKGQVYCQGNLEIGGVVSGSVFTRQFVVNRFGTKYINHLFNVVIENQNVADLYGGIIFKNQKKAIMKWLY